MAMQVVLIVFLPAIASLLIYIFRRFVEKYSYWISFITLSYVTFSVLLMIFEVSAGNVGEYLFWTPWVPMINLTFGFRADGLGLLMTLTISILSTVIAVYSMEYMRHEQNASLYNILYLLFVSGMLGSVLATDLIQFYIFFELMLVPSWGLIHQWGTGLRERIAFKYFIFTHVGALSLLIGILSTGIIYGTFDSLEIAQMARLQDLALGSGMVYFASITMLFGFFVKLATFPLHTWLPDAHAEAPTPISALLSPAMIGIGGYGIVRFVFSAYPKVAFNLFTMLSILALITMVYGGMMALAQDDIKRLLAYSSISQMGYLILGIMSGSTLGLTGALFHYFSHGLCKAVLFLTAGVITREVGLRDIRDLGGLGAKMPYTSVAMVVGFMGIAGIPPLNGFQSEWMIFAGAIFFGVSEEQTLRVIIASLAIIASTLTVAYALWTIKRVLFGEIKDESRVKGDAPYYMTIPVIFLTVLTIITGIFPQILISLLGPVSEQIVGAMIGG